MPRAIVRGLGHHATTFHTLPLVLGSQAEELAQYLDRCRRRRNQADYDRVGMVGEVETAELIDAVRGFRAEVVDWLQREHAELAPR
jgi:hypothetical protein